MALSISVMALLFTVSSFWWLNARRGALVSFEPTVWSGVVNPPRSELRLPVVLHNNGAVPIVVLAMRLRFAQGGEIMLWEWTKDSVQPRPSGTEFSEAAGPFSVNGRSTRELAAAFAGELPETVPHPRAYPTNLEVRLGHKDGWHSVVKFDLRLANMIHPRNYITYTNQADYLTPEELATGAVRLSEMRTAHGLD